MHKNSDKTAADYAKIGRARIDIDAAGGGTLMDGVTAQSWHKIRAALLYELQRMKEESALSVRVFDRLDPDFAERMRRQIERCDAAIERVTGAERPGQRSRPKASKRLSLPPLAAGEWRCDVYRAATDTVRPSIACLIAGVRPAELETGVYMIRSIDDGRRRVHVKVFGAKITAVSGQEERIVTIDAETSAGSIVWRHAGSGSAPALIKRGAARIRKDFAKLREAGKIPQGVSPYSFRHAYCADLKQAQLDRDVIAQAMGHATIKSQQNYGVARQGRGGVRLVSAEATRDVGYAPRTAMPELDQGDFDVIDLSF